MLNPISIMADRLGDYLSDLYLQYFSQRNPEYATYMGGAARLVLERIGNSNALYHNIEHTIMVTLAGQQIVMLGVSLNAVVPPVEPSHSQLLGPSLSGASWQRILSCGSA